MCTSIFKNGTERAKLCPLPSILKSLSNYLPKGQSIDFLTVDVEGLDFEVIRSINLAKYTPKVILAEVLKDDLSTLDQNPMVGYLKGYGYSLSAKTVNTAFFIHQDF